MCYGTITLFEVLVEGSHDTTLVLQPSLRKISSKVFSVVTSLSFCYQICDMKRFHSLQVTMFHLSRLLFLEHQSSQREPKVVLWSL